MRTARSPIALCLLLVCMTVVGRPSASGRTPAAPTLDETLDWFVWKVNAFTRTYPRDPENNCTDVDVHQKYVLSRKSRFVLTEKTDMALKTTCADASRNQDYAQVNEFTIDLKSLDPQTVRVTSWKRPDGNESFTLQAKTVDGDSIPVLSRFSENGVARPEKTVYTGEFYLFFADGDVAERCAKALRHAVELTRAELEIKPEPF